MLHAISSEFSFHEVIEDILVKKEKKFANVSGSSVFIYPSHSVHPSVFPLE